MAIERITEPEQVASLLRFEDNAEDCFPCDRGEWIQWLMKAVVSPKMLIIRVVENGQTTGYLVAQNQVSPPLTDSVYVIYSYSPKNVEKNKEALESLKEWSIECGAKKIKFDTKNILAHKLYGFKETGLVSMEMVL